MTTGILYLHNWIGGGPAAIVGGDNPQAHAVSLYAFEDTDLTNVHSILIPAHTDQRYLLTQKSRLEMFLNKGGTLVVNGHITYPFLDCLRPFEAVTYQGIHSLRVQRVSHHPIFEGVDPEHMTFRRGVAGFYARGSNPVAPGAVVIHTLGQDAMPIDWQLTLPNGGRLFMHSGNDLWMFHGSADSTHRIVPQLFNWLTRESS